MEDTGGYHQELRFEADLGCTDDAPSTLSLLPAPAPAPAPAAGQEARNETGILRVASRDYSAGEVGGGAGAESASLGDVSSSPAPAPAPASDSTTTFNQGSEQMLARAPPAHRSQYLHVKLVTPVDNDDSSTEMPFEASDDLGSKGKIGSPERAGSKESNKESGAQKEASSAFKRVLSTPLAAAMSSTSTLAKNTSSQSSTWSMSRRTMQSQASKGSHLGVVLSKSSREVTRDHFEENFQIIKGLLTFEDCDELRRGSRLSTVLRGCARIFQDSSGSSATYKLSDSVTVINAFVSHNWAVSRWRKYLCLVLHFNFVLGLTALFCWLAMLAPLSYFHMVPEIEFAFDGEPRGFLCRFTSFPVVALVTFFFRELFPPTSKLAGAIVQQE